MRRSGGLIAAVGLMLPLLAIAQPKPVPLAFDVASIKLSQPGLEDGGIKPMPGGNGYIAQNVPVKLMISLMYGVPLRQVVGGPGWIDSDHYDIEAKADHAYSKDDLHEMFRTLLADRFKLKLHEETRDGPVYALMVDGSGIKMKLNDGPQDFRIPITYGRNNDAIGVRVPMQYLCWWLGQKLQQDHRPVIDKTGLTGNYDFTLSYAPDPAPNAPEGDLPLRLQNLPSIFDALRQQLGLRLDRQRGPVEYYVIDSIERPSED